MGRLGLWALAGALLWLAIGGAVYIAVHDGWSGLVKVALIFALILALGEIRARLGRRK